MSARIRLTGAALAVCGVAALAPPAGADVARAEVVGRLERFPEEIVARYGDAFADPDGTPASRASYGQVLLEPRTRRLLQFYWIRRDGRAWTVVYVRDADTLAPVGTIEIPVRITASRGGIGGAAFDGARGRIFVSALDQIVVIDAQRLRWSSIEHGLPNGINPANLTYDPRTDLLYSPVGGSGDPTLSPGSFNGVAAIRATPAPDEEPLVFLRPIRSCRGVSLALSGGPSTPGYTLSVLSVKDEDDIWRLHVPCSIKNGVAGVVIVNAEDPNDSNERAVVGPPSMFGAIGDHGSDRIVFYGTSGTGDSVGAVYDAASAAFIGVVGIRDPGQSPYALGIDQATGTLYGLSSTLGLFAGSLRLDPLPQPVSFAGYEGAGLAAVRVDAARSRLLVLREREFQQNIYAPVDAYDIIRVPRPTTPPPPEDPDRFTAGVAEEAERTRAAFSGTASAYGTRILLARGVQGAVPAGESTGGFQAGGLLMDGFPNRCGFTDRVVSLATIGTSTLSDTGTGARAAEIEVDPNTKVDLEQPSRCDQDGATSLFAPDRLGGITVEDRTLPQVLDEAAGRRWSYRPAECDALDDDATTSRDEDAPDLGSAQVRCRWTEQRLEATAEGRIDLGIVRVASSRATATISRTLGEGVTIHTEAVANGIQIGDIAIGQVRSVAETIAGGRKETATGKFIRELTGVTAPGLPSSVPRSCHNEGCESLITRLNLLLSGRGEFRFSSPDPELCRDRDVVTGACSGTPGGSQAGILKSKFRRASDNALAGDTSWELPGLELILYNDNPHTGRARQLIQLAGVRADATYNISLLPQGIGPPPSEGLGVPPVPDIEPGPAVLDPSSAQPPTPPAPPSVVQRVIQPVADGMRLLFASPARAIRTAAVWLLFAAPVVLGWRRRRLGALTD